jgi:hypothetical protein
LAVVTIIGQASHTFWVCNATEARAQRAAELLGPPLVADASS